MNDDELPMRAETASAYLDGDIDAAERPSVEADAETMALVESFSLVRSTLAAVEPVSDDVKSAAIAAALAEFDAIHASGPAAVVAPAATITALRTRRFSAYRLVTGFAAAAVVAVIALAVLNSTGSDDTSSSGTAAPAIAGASTNDLPALKVADTSAAAGTIAAPSAAAGAFPAGTAAAAGAAADSTTSALVIPEIDDAAALRDFAAAARTRFNSPAPTGAGGSATTQSQQPEFTSISPPACLPANDLVLGPITVAGAPAFAVSNTTNGVVQAIDAGDCRVYLTVTP